MSEGQAAITRRAKASRADPNAREYLAFDLGSAHYALPLPCVREIVRVPLVTEVPRSPNHVLGVISVRGAVTTVFDLRVKLRLTESPPTTRSRILLIDGGGEVVGLLVDNVLQVYRLQTGEIELAAVLGSEAPPYLAGIGRPAKTAANSLDFLLLLDPVALLRSEAHGQA
jgi:purine-binding chemotaxis protein CheW